MKYLDSQDSSEIIETGLMFYLPFSSNKVDMEKTKRIMAEIYMFVPKWWSPGMIYLKDYKLLILTSS